jgi:hypothetical protein
MTNQGLKVGLGIPGNKVRTRQAEFNGLFFDSRKQCKNNQGL